MSNLYVTPGHDSTRRWHSMSRRLPIFPLSAACMFVGCFVLIEALKGEANQVSGLLVLLGVVNAYEVALIGLTLWLCTRARTARDARFLAALAVLFATDAAYLVGEIG